MRVENWLRTPNERELHEQDREILQPLLARVGDQASVVAELVLGPNLQTGEIIMNEAMRLEIVQRHQSGMSQRAIADELGISRGAVTRALARVQAQRDGPGRARARPRRAASIIDPYEPILKELLAKLSEPDRRARRAGTASTRLHRRVHGRASTPAAVAAARRAGARAAL